MRVSDLYPPIPVLAPGDKAAGADGDSIDMANLSSVSIHLHLGSITVADPHVKVFSGATNGTKTTALTFHYRLGGAATGTTGSDVYGTEGTSADLTISNATGDNKVLTLDVSAAQLTSGHRFVTLELGNQATVFMASAMAQGEKRYPGVTAV